MSGKGIDDDDAPLRNWGISGSITWAPRVLFGDKCTRRTIKNTLRENSTVCEDNSIDASGRGRTLGCEKPIKGDHRDRGEHGTVTFFLHDMGRMWSTGRWAPPQRRGKRGDQRGGFLVPGSRARKRAPRRKTRLTQRGGATFLTPGIIHEQFMRRRIKRKK